MSARHTLARVAAVEVARTARALDRLVARLSLLAVPPPAVMDRARASVVAEGIAQGRADLQLVHGSAEPAGWVDCSLGTISATRPIGALVRFRDLDGAPQEGRIATLGASEVSLVYYRLGVEVYTPEGPELLLWDLPLSHPLEVLRD